MKTLCTSLLAMLVCVAAATGQQLASTFKPLTNAGFFHGGPAPYKTQQCPGGVCPIPRQGGVRDGSERGNAGGSATGNPPAPVFPYIVDASVHIWHSDGRGQSHGSGVIINIDPATRTAEVLTNKHVAPNNAVYRVRFPSGKEVTAKWEKAATDDGVDLALLRIPADETTPYIPLDTQMPEKGEPVFQVGYPGGKEPARQRAGLWLGISGNRGRAKVYEASIKSMPGDSGSGVFSQKTGRLVALVWGGNDNPNAIVAAMVSLDDMKRFTNSQLLRPIQPIINIPPAPPPIIVPQQPPIVNIPPQQPQWPQYPPSVAGASPERVSALEQLVQSNQARTESRLTSLENRAGQPTTPTMPAPVDPAIASQIAALQAKIGQPDPTLLASVTSAHDKITALQAKASQPVMVDPTISATVNNALASATAAHDKIAALTTDINAAKTTADAAKTQVGTIASQVLPLTKQVDTNGATAASATAAAASAKTSADAAHVKADALAASHTALAGKLTGIESIVGAIDPKIAAAVSGVGIASTPGGIGVMLAALAALGVAGYTKWTSPDGQKLRDQLQADILAKLHVQIPALTGNVAADFASFKAQWPAILTQLQAEVAALKAGDPAATADAEALASAIAAKLPLSAIGAHGVDINGLLQKLMAAVIAGQGNAPTPAPTVDPAPLVITPAVVPVAAPVITPSSLPAAVDPQAFAQAVAAHLSTLQAA